MKKVPCNIENCIPTPSSCVIWNGGTNKTLDICDGASLNDIVWEITGKLDTLALEDFSTFDIDALAGVCGKLPPVVVDALAILNVLKDNDLCFKERIDDLAQEIVDLENDQTPNVNLKCFQQTDNQGNSLTITRDSFDQLIVDNLCSQRGRIESLEGQVVTLQSEIDNIDATATVDELTFATCIDPGIKPTSSQVISIAEELCDLELALGTSSDINTALANTPGDLNAEFGLITGWVLAPANWAQNYGNLLLEVESLRQRVINMETNCCASTCKDVEIGFSVIFNEDKTGLILKFTTGAGTDIPAGFTDAGSTGTITDKNGAVEYFTLSIANNYQTEVSIVGLDMTGDLEVSVASVMTNGTLVCQQCHKNTVKTTGVCDFCRVCAGGTTGTVTIIYDDEAGGMA